MEEIKVKGIVIKAIDYKDSDKIVTIFSAEKGLLKARVRGVKKNKAKLSFAVQPFAFVEFLISEKNGFSTVINATSIDQFFDLTSDFDNYIFMLSCMEVIEKTMKENDVNKDMFLLLLNCFNLVCYKGVSAMNVFVKFMLDALKILGFGLQINNCSICGNEINAKACAFSYEYNGLICSRCSNNNECLEISEGEYLILSRIDMSSLDGLQTLKFYSRDSMMSVISLLLKVFRVNTDEEIVTIKKFL